MNLENTKKQMRKGVLELCILAIIADEDSYSTNIIEKLKTSELIVKEGTLYPLLSRLKNAGLLTYNWQESENSPPRKYYQVTGEGESFLQDLSASWQQLVDSVSAATQSLAIKEKTNDELKE
ncbi:MAG: PadR family transcriptional regulator [Saprospiraceae bacterium]